MRTVLSERPVPAAIVTGFLGAGKTTLINRVLAAADGRRLAVVENELGEESIDGELLADRAELIEIAGGCLCCTVQGQLHCILARLAARAGELDGLLVETTGVADPAPVIRAFQGDGVRQAFRIQGVVTVVDALHHEPSREWRAQVRLADLLVLSRAEHVDPAVLAALVARLRELNPGATVEREPPLDLLERPRAARAPDAHEHAHAHEDGHGFASVALRVDGEVDPGALEAWLTVLTRASDMEVLRVKGVLALPGEPRRYVVHGVRALLDGALERPWRGPRRSRLVVIGRRLDEEALRAGFGACAARATASR